MRFPSLRTLLPLAIVLAPAAVRAQGASLGPFDPKSGRFAAALPAESRRTPDTLSVPQAKAWPAIYAVYTQLGIPLSVVDTESHVLGALRVTHRRPIAGQRFSRLLECGTGAFGPNADRYTVQVIVLTSVQALPDGRTTVDTRVGGVASPNGLGSSVNCGTTGVLEDRITEELRKALGA